MRHRVSEGQHGDHLNCVVKGQGDRWDLALKGGQAERLALSDVYGSILTVTCEVRGIRHRAELVETA
eukprot:scaffold4013_cov429-Prasinococcus_capsulatus_cf.AAC.7